MAENEPIHAVLTTLSIIEHLAAADGSLGVSEIAAAIGSPKPRVYRHLRTLLQQRYVMQDPATDKYLLTLRLFYLSQSLPEKTSFIRESSAVLPALRDRVRQTVAIGMIEEEGVRVVEILRHRAAIQITTPPGTLFPFHGSAQGKLALAYACPAKLRKVLSSLPASNAADDQQDRLRDDLQRIRTQGWAVAPEEVLLGVNALAAPVFDASGALCGTIAIVGSVQYISAQPEPDMLAALTGAASDISKRLGFSEAP